MFVLLRSVYSGKSYSQSQGQGVGKEPYPAQKGIAKCHTGKREWIQQRMKRGVHEYNMPYEPYLHYIRK